MAGQISALEKLVEIKKYISFFKDLNDDGIYNTIGNAKFIKYEPEELIFYQNSWSLEIFIVVGGEILIFDEVNDDEAIILATLRSYDVFGEMCSLTYEPRSASAIAGPKGATLISFVLKRYNPLYANDFAVLYKNFIKILSEKLRDANDQLFKLQNGDETIDLNDVDRLA